MQVLATVRDSLQFLGIARNECSNTKIENIIRRIICVFIMSNAAISVMWFVIFEAKTFSEYANPLLLLITVYVCILIFYIMLQQSERFEKLFGDFFSKIQERM